MKYAVTATRQSAALFYAWEYGTARAVRKMSEVRNGFGALAHFRTRREAEQFRSRVFMVVTWQRGRLGMSINDGGIFVVSHEYRPLTEA